MKISQECMNKARRFFMRDNELQIRLLPGEDAQKIAQAFKDYYHVDLVEVFDEFGQRVVAVC